MHTQTSTNVMPLPGFLFDFGRVGHVLIRILQMYVVVGLPLHLIPL